jgi:hypothetical protein
VYLISIARPFSSGLAPSKYNKKANSPVGLLLFWVMPSQVRAVTVNAIFLLPDKESDKPKKPRITTFCP